MAALDSVILDIECWSLYPDIGVTLAMCWESSTNPGKVHTLRIDQTDRATWKAGLRGVDRELVKAANEVIRNHDIIIAHNGRRFDIPWLRTRAMVNKLQPLRDVVIVDPVLIARSKLRLHNNRLGSLASAIGSEERKTPLDLTVWRSAVLDGNKAALDSIVEHCVADIKTLAVVTQAVKPFIRQFNDRGSDF